MAKKKRIYWIILGILIFIVYVFLAARPVAKETVLTSRWLSPLDAPPAQPESGENLLPFELGSRFGYVDEDGRFALNRIRDSHISLSGTKWAEYGPEPQQIEVKTPRSGTVMTIEDPRGYPLFLDGRTFLVKREQSGITALDEGGQPLWSYDFPAPLTCIDASAGLVIAGLLDGTIELLDSQGTGIFFFEPGGSRLSAILGCALSADGSRLAVISGIDEQRFLLLERSGDSYRVVYHEFLSEGFRRPVHLGFIDRDSRVVFERKDGIGIYDINTRASTFVPLDGTVYMFDGSGGDGLLFIITAEEAMRKNLVVIRLPGTVITEAPFTSETAFLGRRDSLLYIGGDRALAAFQLDKR
ncbi:WD40 repeat domain-containing protein [Breznakiella homolactica]|uniref:WD40 repeat domain-containing protein n=1 Tax=Breznakiella homolactica TaxID=2798577 RepID=A0A7T7XRP1_9SPIR|nr:WD40 repeat domain-containing protein [Breznakiella homolactica]QQO11262.1 WD40 repeat domain-containing protein [Breznakiella homolactica]